MVGGAHALAPEPPSPSSDPLRCPLPCRITRRYLQDNQLVGPVPSELGELVMLYGLYVPLANECSGGEGCGACAASSGVTASSDPSLFPPPSPHPQAPRE
jgi:hypothetical protein